MPEIEAADMIRPVVVQRAFKGPGGKLLIPGQLLDAAEWRWVDRLIEQKRLRPATASDIANAIDVDDRDMPGISDEAAVSASVPEPVPVRKKKPKPAWVSQIEMKKKKGK